MLCNCGCGQETKTWKRTYGDKKKGESQEYIRFHWSRGPRTIVAPPNPSGICQCGCGGGAPIATMTNARIGHMAGEHVRFIRGHVGNLKRHESITPDMWLEEDLGYKPPCWIFQAYPLSGGYRRLRLKGIHRLAHVAMYEQEVGPIPKGLYIDHLCRQTACINPAHLEAVTPAENIRRSPFTKLTMEIAREIRASDETHRVLGERYGVCNSRIWMIKSGKAWVE